MLEEEEKAPEEPPPEEEAVVTIFGKLKRTKVTKVSNCTCSSCDTLPTRI